MVSKSVLHDTQRRVWRHYTLVITPQNVSRISPNFAPIEENLRYKEIRQSIVLNYCV